MSEREPWAIYWNDETRDTGLVWAETRKQARSIASNYGGVVHVDEEPQNGGWNLPDEDEHFMGRHLNDNVPVDSTV